MKNYYFDNSTTSFPKPKEVAEEMYNFLMNVGGTYGKVNTKRGKETTQKIEECRELLAENFLGIKNASNIVFTPGATRSINDILIGLDLNNCKVLISALEHNAVVRPIYKLSINKNVEYKIIPSIDGGIIDINALAEIIKKEKIALVIINMESNISGVIQPIKKIKETIGYIPLLVDATQSVGIHDIKADEWNIDFIAFMALLSINLGLINLFPIPLLDGGHVVIYLIEIIAGREINERAKEYVFRFGFLVLISLMIFATYNDFNHLFNRWFS